MQHLASFTINRLLSLSRSRTVLVSYQLCGIRNYSTRMSTVFVRNCENDDRLHISLDLKIPKENGNTTIKTFNFSRLKHGELGLTVDRLRLSVGKKLVKKNKQRKKDKMAATSEANKSEEEPGAEIPVEIVHNGSVLDLSVTNEYAWIDGAVLRVWEEDISICYNPPSVKLQSLPKTIMVGFPLFPEVEFEFTDLNHCEFYWKIFDEKHLNKLRMEFNKGALDLANSVKVQSFTPRPEDFGKFLLLACLPKNGTKAGKMEVVFSANAITEGPGPCPFERRAEYTKEFSENGEFRVLSYNLLAQIYGDTDLARTELFSYCPPTALDMDYRKHLLLKEILGYKADLLCLQEVDKSIFNSHLVPAMQALGYTGLFRSKDGHVSEGCASFFHERKFQVINQLDIVLSPFLASDPICADIWAEVCKVPQLRAQLEQRSTVLQVTVAESKERPGKYVCLANTHFYFYPSACNIRLIHAAAATRYLQNVCDTYKQEGKDISLVFCGDFNSAPPHGVYQLLTSQFIPSDHADWNSAGADELITTLELHQAINLESACGTPPYTNFTRGFQATLDYVFVDSDRLEVSKVIPLPSHEEVTANVALPSCVFPSDHVALICELKFK